MAIKVPVSTSVDLEVEVEVSFEDIVAALPSPDDLDHEGLPYHHTLARSFNAIYAYLEALRPEHIAAIKPEARKAIAKAFRELAQKMEDA